MNFNARLVTPIRYFTNNVAVLMHRLLSETSVSIDMFRVSIERKKIIHNLQKKKEEKWIIDSKFFIKIFRCKSYFSVLLFRKYTSGKRKSRNASLGNYLSSVSNPFSSSSR